MKIAIAYPPVTTHKGVPLLSQNRQFQYFKEPTYIYPVVPAQAATLLKQDGHEVLWIDGVAAEIAYGDFLEVIRRERPDVVAMETKTPVVTYHWRVIEDLKKLAAGRWPLTAVLFGDHVTALPGESFERSMVDFVLTGGDYDFLLANLCRSFDVEHGTWNVERFEPGIWYRKIQEIKSTGSFKLDHDLDAAPLIDRDLTQWRLYSEKNGNFKRTPGTYIMAGRDCWWGRCKFCSWPTLYPQYRTRSVRHVLGEISLLTERHGVREIMDDTGTFPVGDWLLDFCEGIIKEKLNTKVTLDCNMRFGVLDERQCVLMKKAGFRLVLFGLESANQATLDRLDKHVRVEEIVASCKAARSAGLYPHITIMFGYPWETYEDAKRTLELGRWLLKKDLAYTVQATIVIPYPGTVLFRECQTEGWLNSSDWDDYDMKRPVMKTPVSDAQMAELVQGVYRVAFDPEFVFNRIASIRSLADIAYFARGVKKVAGHILDFKSTRRVK